jgi:hypothetical protein
MALDMVLYTYMKRLLHLELVGLVRAIVLFDFTHELVCSLFLPVGGALGALVAAEYLQHVLAQHNPRDHVRYLCVRCAWVKLPEECRVWSSPHR